MNPEIYEKIQKEGGFIAKTLKRHVQEEVTAQYRKMVLDGLIPVNQSVADTTATVRKMVSSYIEEVLPDNVDYYNIDLFV